MSLYRRLLDGSLARQQPQHLLRCLSDATEVRKLWEQEPPQGIPTVNMEHFGYGPETSTVKVIRMQMGSVYTWCKQRYVNKGQVSSPLTAAEGLLGQMEVGATVLTPRDMWAADVAASTLLQARQWSTMATAYASFLFHSDPQTVQHKDGYSYVRVNEIWWQFGEVCAQFDMYRMADRIGCLYPPPPVRILEILDHMGKISMSDGCPDPPDWARQETDPVKLLHRDEHVSQIPKRVEDSEPLKGPARRDKYAREWADKMHAEYVNGLAAGAPSRKRGREDEARQQSQSPYEKLTSRAEHNGASPLLQLPLPTPQELQSQQQPLPLQLPQRPKPTESPQTDQGQGPKRKRRRPRHGPFQVPSAVANRKEDRLMWRTKGKPKQGAIDDIPYHGSRMTVQDLIKAQPSLRDALYGGAAFHLLNPDDREDGVEPRLSKPEWEKDRIGAQPLPKVLLRTVGKDQFVEAFRYRDADIPNLAPLDLPHFDEVQEVIQVGLLMMAADRVNISQDDFFTTLSFIVNGVTALLNREGEGKADFSTLVGLTAYVLRVGRIALPFFAKAPGADPSLAVEALRYSATSDLAKDMARSVRGFRTVQEWAEQSQMWNRQNRRLGQPVRADLMDLWRNGADHGIAQEMRQYFNDLVMAMHFGPESLSQATKQGLPTDIDDSITLAEISDKRHEVRRACYEPYWAKRVKGKWWNGCIGSGKGNVILDYDASQFLGVPMTTPKPEGSSTAGQPAPSDAAGQDPDEQKEPSPPKDEPVKAPVPESTAVARLLSGGVPNPNSHWSDVSSDASGEDNPPRDQRKGSTELPSPGAEGNAVIPRPGSEVSGPEIGLTDLKIVDDQPMEQDSVVLAE